MKYAVALLTLAIATPVYAQSSEPETDQEQVDALLRAFLPADAAEAVVNSDQRDADLGVEVTYKGPLSTLATVTNNSATTTRAAPSAPTRVAAAPARATRQARPARTVDPSLSRPAEVTAEVKGSAPLMVTFATNSAKLTDAGQIAVNSFAKVINLVDQEVGATDQKYLIEGHTDAVGAEEFNLELSQKRAQAVIEALVALGVPAERLVAEGKGESEPIEGRTGRDPLNRRVIAKQIN